MEVATMESLRIKQSDLEDHVKTVVNFIHGWSKHKHFVANIGNHYHQDWFHKI